MPEPSYSVDASIELRRSTRALHDAARAVRDHAAEIRDETAGTLQRIRARRADEPAPG